VSKGRQPFLESSSLCSLLFVPCSLNLAAGKTAKEFNMKKRILTAGVAALVLLFVTTGLTGCAATDQRALRKAGIPQDQRVDL
jgi:hypothetical protein